jgi:uncharacterized protein
MKRVISLLCGALFGAGVCISGMVRPSKVLAFLDLGGAWDPSLAVVMAVALALHVLAWRFAIGTPRLGSAYPAPPSTVVDARLVGGSALFGLGWGLAGFCPGPAMVSVVTGVTASLVFVGAMAATMMIYQRADRTDGCKDETVPV